MSDQIKLLALVLVGSMVAFYLVQQAVLSTNHLPEQFTASSTSYLDRTRGDKGATPASQVAAEKTDQLRQEIALERRQVAQEQQVATSRRTEAAPVSENRNTDDQYAGLGPIPVAKTTNSATRSAASLQTGQTENSNVVAAVQQRSDSDADMRQTNTIKSNDISASKPQRARIGATTTSSIKKKPKTVHALDLAYVYPQQTTCAKPSDDPISVGVMYRQSSFAIKGISLSNIDKLVALYRKCSGGKFVVVQNQAGLTDTDDNIVQLRKDEVKYYLLQRRIPKADMLFPDNS